MNTAFPQSSVIVESVGGKSATVRLKVGNESLRPGGTVSGPAMMGTVDAAIYVALFGEIGIVPLAVTTSLNFNFLRKPSADRDIIAVCKLIKIGRLLAVGEVAVYSEGDDEPVAHAVGTYAIPSKRE